MATDASSSLDGVKARETNPEPGIVAQAVGREVWEEYSVEPLEGTTLDVRNVLRENPLSHWVAVVFAIKVDPDRVSMDEPHTFDRLDWISPDKCRPLTLSVQRQLRDV